MYRYKQKLGGLPVTIRHGHIMYAERISNRYWKKINSDIEYEDAESIERDYIIKDVGIEDDTFIEVETMDELNAKKRETDESLY